MQRCVCVAKFLAEVISDLYEICACYLSTGVLLLDFDNTKSPDVLKKKKKKPSQTYSNIKLWLEKQLVFA